MVPETHQRKQPRRRSYCSTPALASSNPAAAAGTDKAGAPAAKLRQLTTNAQQFSGKAGSSSAPQNEKHFVLDMLWVFVHSLSTRKILFWTFCGYSFIHEERETFFLGFCGYSFIHEAREIFVFWLSQKLRSFCKSPHSLWE